MDAHPLTLLVGTQKGLFRLWKAGRDRWDMSGPHIEGYEILHVLDSRAEPGVLLAAAHHKIWGAHIYRSADGGVNWASLPASPAHPVGRFPTALRAIWYLAESPHDGSLYAGIDPAGLFRSTDRGESWTPVEGLNEHPTRALWEPAKGGFSVHSIHVDPATPAHLYAAVSAGGAFRSLDGGAEWTAINQGVRAENRPDRFPVAGHNIHRLVMHPARPDRLYRQCYSGVYRSDDGGDHWTEITANLPSDFGYALVCDPADADTAWQIPVSSSHMRTVPDGSLRVYRTTNAGDSWESVSDGLPDRHVYVSVLREAMDFSPGESGGVYFGTTAGQVFARPRARATWEAAADYLPRVLSIRARPEP